MKIQFELDSFYTASDLIAKLLDGDGAGSGLDADKLDGQHGSYYLPAGTYTAADILAKLLTVDGHGTGLDADKLDGTELSKILALGITIPGSANLNTYNATGLFHQPSTANAVTGSNYPVALAGMLEVIADGSLIYQKYTAYDSAHNIYLRTCDNGTWYNWTRILDTADLTTINNNLALKLNASVYTAADILAKLITVDGSGSGLDADTLDGTHLSVLIDAINAKLNASTYTAADILTKLKTVDGSTTGLDADLLDGQHGAYYLPAGTYTAADILSKLLTVDGHGSGLDADTVDAATPSATGGTANAIAKAREDGTLDPGYLPFTDKSGTFRLPKLIEEKTLSAVSTVTFSELNGNSDEEYLVISNLTLSAQTAAFLLPNGLTTSQKSGGMLAKPDTHTQHDAGDYAFMIANSLFGNAGAVCYSETNIQAKTGSNRLSFSKQTSSGTYLENGNFSSMWGNTATNITSLVLRLDSGTATGWIKLYKMVDVVIS